MKLETFIKSQLPIYLPYILLGGVSIYIFKKYFSSDTITSGGKSFDPSKIKIEPTLLSKSENYLNIVADSQYLAMDMYGTDEDLLFKSLDGLNAEDLKLVNKYFGKRCSRIYLLPGVSQCISPYLNLFEWYSQELDATDLEKMKAIWLKTGLI